MACCGRRGSGTPGPPGPPGPAGEDGQDGTRWFNGSGAPVEPIPGSNAGDYYIDNDTGNYYVLTTGAMSHG